MPEVTTVPGFDLKQRFQEYERGIRVRNYRFCGVLAAIFMLLGTSLDWVVYRWEGVVSFIGLRIISAIVLVALSLVLLTPWATKLSRILGLCISIPPIASIAWMIYAKEGADSPYYAGLNLVMLGAAILMRWSLTDSLIVVTLTLVSYLVACVAHDKIVNDSIFFNNLYFLVVTGAITTAGTWFFNQIRLSEFKLRHDLDVNAAELELANTRLEDSNKQLRELDEVKNRFFANISHELRTPLTLLIAPIETLINRGENIQQEQKRDILGTMQANAMRLLKLINDLLDLVRLESGRAQVRNLRTDLKEFMLGLSNAVSTLVNDKHIRMTTHVDNEIGLIMSDTEKLERICLNLLFNAIKFTAAGGSVDFTARKDGDWIIIEVRDSGMGIPAEQLPHIFNRFWQADTSSQRKFQGMGIGLALVKELAEVQGGSVSVASEVGKGTIMSVTLPLELASSEVSADVQRESSQTTNSSGEEWIGELYRRAELFPAITSLHSTIRPTETSFGFGFSKRPKLLIADDEPDMLRFLRSQLSENFDVLEAVDGQQAVDKACQFLPDIILSDMMMPEKDGLQVCRELRERTSTRIIPVVLLTARADERTKIECLAAGASDFLSKPFSMVEVSVRLKNLVESYQYQKELSVQKQHLEAALEQVKETETLLVRNEKLASLGRMSAGLIHEINNPLNYASQGLHLMKRVAPLLPEEEQADFADTLKDVQEGVNRVVRIISDLRGFTRVTNEMNHVFDIKTVIETAMRFFGSAWKEGVKNNLNIPSDLNVKGDSNHFVQVIINLVQNALDAMKTKTYSSDDPPTINISAESLGDRVVITFRDNGPGIPESIRANVFDSFFTTKDVGAGMGLGLGICHRIMAEHGGQIDVRSELGVFTEFVLEFPSA